MSARLPSELRAHWPLVLLGLFLLIVAVRGGELPPLPPEPKPKGHLSITQAENSAVRLRAAKARQATNNISNGVLGQPALPGPDLAAVRAQALADDLFRISMEQQQRRYWTASPKERAGLKPMPPLDRNSPRERIKSRTALAAEQSRRRE